MPCVGHAVSGITDYEWPEVCRLLLGVTPPANKLDGQRLSLSWLAETFAELPDDASDEQAREFARAYILRLIGGTLMPDKSSRNVYLMYLPLLMDFEECGKLSWGSAVLAYLYRELCRGTKYDRKDIGGCLMLLHLWAWDRFPMLAPSRPPMPDIHADIFPIPPPLGYRYYMITISFQAILFLAK